MSDEDIYALYVASGRNASSLASELGCSPQSARKRVSRVLARMGEGPMMLEQSNPEIANLILHELGKSSIAPEGSQITGAWIKGKHLSVHLKPDAEDRVPAWPLIQPAPRKTIQFTPTDYVPGESQTERVFIWPDTQIGYHRSIYTDELLPFHDLDAIDVALQVLHAFKPDRVVILGDFLDLPSLSRYLQVAEFSVTLQPSIHYGYELLCLIRSAVGPTCLIDYIAGNHERRLAENIATNARAAYGLRKGGDISGWPQLSIPALLDLEALDIKYSDEFPGGQVWLTPKLVCQHQDPASSDLRASIIHGHNERRKLDTRTIHSYEGVETYETWCFPGFGNIEDVDDPTSLGRTRVASNRTRKSANQGYGLVYILPNGRHHIVDGSIVNGSTVYAEQEFRSRLLADS